VHPDLITKNNQTRCNYIGYFIVPSQHYMFRAMFYAHHQEHLTVFTASGNIHKCRCRLVNITRCCKYSQVPLMMGEKHRPKHVELTRNNIFFYLEGSTMLPNLPAPI
jgi:hypothetical protein